ncbi:MAG TPA: glutaredoxin family protein [bacterium]|nr:glutaredoxin family protein [bacterium]
MFCRRVEEFLTQHGVAFQARNIAEDPSAMDELERLGVATTPVTVIDGEIVVGFDRKRLTALLGLPERDAGARGYDKTGA